MNLVKVCPVYTGFWDIFYLWSCEIFLSIPSLVFSIYFSMKLPGCSLISQQSLVCLAPRQGLHPCILPATLQEPRGSRQTWGRACSVATDLPRGAASSWPCWALAQVGVTDTPGQAQSQVCYSGVKCLCAALSVAVLFLCQWALKNSTPLLSAGNNSCRWTINRR